MTLVLQKKNKFYMRLQSFIIYLVIAVLLCCLLASTVSARDTNTIEIANTTNLGAPACLDYRIKGVCLWLMCWGPFCRVKTSPRISHYNPDVVVSVYARTFMNPWAEMAILGMNPIYKGGTVSAPIRKGISRWKLRFKNVDVIGNPLVSTTFRFRAMWACQSKAISFMPYFLSNLDSFSWMWGLPERLFPQSYIPGLREIGTFPLNTWGSVYPRVGFIADGSEVKRSAVMAQRAADIITRRRQPHVYRRLRGCWGQGCEAPPTVKENNPNRGKWQMISPKPSLTCDVFGKNDVLSPVSWAGGKHDDEKQYAWNLWQKYTCCIPRIGLYIGHVP